MSPVKRAVALGALALVASGGFGALSGWSAGSAGSDEDVGPMRAGAYTWKFYDFFNVPYDTWWTDTGQRPRVYGDVVLSTAYPYTNWYPWAEDKNDPTIYTSYRIDMGATGTTGWTQDNPVILPRFGSGTVIAPITLDWYMQYISNTRRTELAGAGCFIPSGGMDGFIMEVQSTFSMDLATAAVLFGVTGDPATWWDANTNPGCTDYGALEVDWEMRLLGLGNGVYDVYNSYECVFGPWFTDVGYSISGNTITVSFHHVTWGIEVLMARWMYWGSTTYESMGTPLGWGPGEPGAPAAAPPPGVSQPSLSDYLYSGRDHPVSELDPYIGRDTRKTTPGSIYYGDLGPDSFVPKEWDLLAGESVTWDFPEGNVVWYSPQSPETSDPATLLYTTGPLTLVNRLPTGFGTWDEATNSLTVTGPLDGALPANPDYGTPYVEIGTETAPPPVVEHLADLVRKSAWPERHHYVIGRDPDGTQTLYGKVENLGTEDTAVLVRFSVAKTGGPATGYDSATTVLAPGQRMDLTAGLTGLTPGKYGVSAQAWDDSDGGGNPGPP